MKKTLALIAVLSAAITMASAAPVLSIHGAVGEGWGTTFEDSAINDKIKPFGNNLDFNFGVGLNFSLGGKFGIQPEVDFAINNAGYQNAIYDETSYTFTYSSIDVPVLLTFRFNKWNFLVGPYVSFPLGTLTQKTTNSYGNTTTDDAIAISNAPFTLWGLTVGLGYEERLGTGRLVIGARYSLDFTPIQVKTPVLLLGTTSKAFTRRALYIDLSYKFALDF